MTPQYALAKLCAGNARFVTGTPRRRDLLSELRANAEEQNPFAAILSCVDSRKSVELLFDADEHTGRLGGMRAWLARQPEGVAGVFIGYPGDERIMIGSRGFWRARLRVYGEPGHSGAGRKKAVNALSKAALLVRELEESSLPQGLREDFPLPPKLTVTGLRGGGDFALVPDVATVDVDVRLYMQFRIRDGKIVYLFEHTDKAAALAAAESAQ